MTDQLRERLARLDPMHPGVDTEPPSRELLEGIMSTPVIEQPETGPEQKSNRWLVGIAAAAALVLAVAGAIALTGGGTDPVASGPPLELTGAVETQWRVASSSVSRSWPGHHSPSRAP